MQATPGLHRKRRQRNWIKGAVLGATGLRRCPLCRNMARLVGVSWMHAHLRCRRCHLVFVADLPSPENIVRAYQRVHLEEYQVEHKQDWEPWKSHKELTLNALGVSPPHPGGRALDLGCGEGRLLQVLKGCGWTAEGIELNPRLADEATRLGFEVRVGAVEQVTAPGAARFELITLFHLLEHLRSPWSVLRRVREWTAPQGMLVLETPLSPDFENIDHLFCFSAAALELTLRRARFAPRAWFDYVDDNYRHHNLACLAQAGD